MITFGHIRAGMVLVLTAICAHGATKYVTPSGSGGYTGDDWTNAYSNVQQAVDALTGTGDIIYLKEGTYSYSTNLNGDPNGFVVVTARPGLTLSGAYTGSGAPGPQGGNPSVITRTPNTTNRIFYVVNSTLTWERVTISDGYTRGQGGGIWATNSFLLLTNSVVANNLASHAADPGRGGGMLAAGTGTLEIADCVFSNNFVDEANGYRTSYGGALCTELGIALTIRRSTFRGNAARCAGSSTPYGGTMFVPSWKCVVSDSLFTRNADFALNRPIASGDIYLSGAGCSAWFNNCVILGNTPTYDGGNGFFEDEAIVAASAYLSMSNCLIAGNGGDGIFFSSPANYSILNYCTVVDNGGVGVAMTGYRHVVVTNSIVCGNRQGDIRNGSAYPHIGYTYSQDSWAGTGNSTNAPVLAYGYYLSVAGLQGQTAGSPCIDAAAQTASAAGLDLRSTRTDGATDTGNADLGYHPTAGLSAEAMSNSLIYVNASGGDDAREGWTGGGAVKTLSRAIAKATYGAVLNIAPGIYQSSETFPLLLSQPNMTLRGANRTTSIIRGDGTNRVFTCLGNGRLRMENLTIEQGMDKTAGAGGGGIHLNGAALAMSNCVVRGNAVSASTQDATVQGGGILASHATLEAVDCLFSDNGARYGNRSILQGGSVCSLMTSSAFTRVTFTGLAQTNGSFYGSAYYGSVRAVTLTDCVVTGNYGFVRDYGVGSAAVYCGGVGMHRVDLVNTTFRGNVASNTAANGTLLDALYIYQDGYRSPRANITGCIFESNGIPRTVTADQGAVIYESVSLPCPVTLTNCLFAANQKHGFSTAGGSLGPSGLVVNCTFANNTGCGMTNHANSAFGIRNCIAWGNGIAGISTNGSKVWALDFTDSQEAFGGTGNQSADPRFVKGPFGNYYLNSDADPGADSLCIDAGGDTATAIGLTNRTTRTDSVFDTGTVDMGFHYAKYFVPPATGSSFMVR